MEDWLEYIKHALDPTRSSMEEHATREWIKNNPAYFNDRQRGNPGNMSPPQEDIQRPAPLGANPWNMEGNPGGHNPQNQRVPWTVQYDEPFIDYLLNGPAQQGGLR